MELSSERRKRLYDLIRQRFIQRAKSEKGDAKFWKTILIDELSFDNYYRAALTSLEFRIDNDLSDEKDRELWMIWHGEPLGKDELQKKREREAQLEGEGTDYDIDPRILRQFSGESEAEREAEIKHIAREFNEGIEEKMRETICPHCKSSICRCNRQ